MKEIYVVYWSTTGNTQAMAEAVGEGIEQAGAKAKVVEVSSIDASVLKDQSCFALGAPASGSEELDEEMESFVEQVETFAGGKRVALFGSHDWGDGEWMRTWTERMVNAGATVVNGEGLVVELTPDDDALAACKELGKKLAEG